MDEVGVLFILIGMLVVIIAIGMVLIDLTGPFGLSLLGILFLIIGQSILGKKD